MSLVLHKLILKPTDFVEFGATDGVTSVFQKFLAYGKCLRVIIDMARFILAEPARGWHDDLHANQKYVESTRAAFGVKVVVRLASLKQIRGEYIPPSQAL